MSSKSIVKDFNVLKDACFSLLFGKEALLVNQFCFQRAHEGFCDGVIIAVTFAAHALRELKFVQQVFEIRTRILGAAIRVKDETWFGLPTSYGLFECIYNQLLAQVTTHRPANDLARETVQNHGQIEPPFPCPDIGDVAEPDLIGSGCREVSIDKVWRHRQLMPGVGGDFEPASCFGADTILFHQASYSVFTAMNALSLKLMSNARRTINTPAHLVGISDFFQKLLVLLFSLANTVPLPGVVAAPGYTQYPAHSLHLKSGAIF